MPHALLLYHITRGNRRESGSFIDFEWGGLTFMSNGKNGVRPFLASYDLVKELPVFFNHMLDVASDFEYIAVAGRRCFNLLIWYLEDDLPGNVTSFNGLLLQYEQIASYYQVNQRFPSILMVDDIMVHGRGVAKTISHLESLVFEILLPTGRWTINRLRRDFADAMHIRIYARNKRTLVLEERFFDHFQWDLELYSGELRDLSMQLSDAMTRWEMPNTSFVPSIHLKVLSDTMDRQSESGGAFGDWQCMKWYYDHEKMVLAYRLSGGRRINRISTIRLFPSRSQKNPPWISSFTILGKMRRSTMEKLCDAAYNAFELSMESSLGRILRSSKAPLQHCRGQLISYIVSAVDLVRFIHETGINVEIDISNSDVTKIARNFGIEDDELNRSLLKVMQSADLANKLHAVLYSTLDSDAGTIFELPYADGCLEEVVELKEDKCNRINDLVLDIVFRMGINAENRAFVLKEKPYLFQPESFQDYQEYYYLKLRRVDNPEGFWNEKYADDDDDERFGRDGAISTFNFFDLIRSRAMKGGVNFGANAPYFLASFIMLMDIGIMGSMPQISNLTDDFVPLARAGELATFYFPNKVALFVPAFALLEARYYRVGSSERNAVTSFYGTMCQKLKENRASITRKLGFIDKDAEKAEMLISLLPDVDTVDRNTELLYRAGQSFRGWDFPNLCYPDYSIKRKLQIYLKAQAKELLQLD